MVERPILLISTPRSGSDWFAESCLQWRPPDYFREYFNPVCNATESAILRLAFGSERDWVNVALPWECQDDVCDFVFQSIWSRNPFRFVKENFASFKIGFFRRYFDCFALVGHRMSTFPGGSRPRWTEYWWFRYFQSLEFNRGLIGEEVGRLVDRALSGPLDLHRKLVAAQVVATYQTLIECRRYDIPVVEYRRLVALPSAADVSEYLRSKVPAALMDEGFADRVVETRKVSDKSNGYDAWGVEEFAQGLIELIPDDLKSYF